MAADMCDFAKDDVLILAKAIVEDPLIYMDGDYTPYFYCMYCDATYTGYHAKVELFTHDPSCPVLVAHDILTRNL